MQNLATGIALACVQSSEARPRILSPEIPQMNAFRRTSIAAATLLGLMAGSLAVAGSDDTEEGQRGKHQRAPVVLAEAGQRIAERSAAMDLDGDGFITADEALAHHKAMREERMKKRFESRHGERISVQDHAAQQLERIAKHDTNGDGTVDREEMMAARKAMRAEGRGHGRGHGGHHND